MYFKENFLKGFREGKVKIFLNSLEKRKIKGYIPQYKKLLVIFFKIIT